VWISFTSSLTKTREEVGGGAVVPVEWDGCADEGKDINVTCSVNQNQVLSSVSRSRTEKPYSKVRCTSKVVIEVIQ
jgi:hypothetical protein